MTHDENAMTIPQSLDSKHAVKRTPSSLKTDGIASKYIFDNRESPKTYLSNLDSIDNNTRYIDFRRGCTPITARRIEPLLWVPIVERPRRDNDESCEGGARESDPECKVDVLLDVADDESCDLLQKY